jgi:hypothetical protein
MNVDAWQMPVNECACAVCGSEMCEDSTHVSAPVRPGFRSAAELMREPRPVEVIEGIAYAGRISVLVSESGTGKTFLLLSQAAAVTTGTDWHGRSVRAGSVAYVSYEGDALGLRLRALREVQGHRLECLYFLQQSESLSPYIDRDRVELAGPGELAVRESLDDLRASLAGKGLPPVRLLVIDTVRASMSGSEDSSEHVSAYLRAVRRLATHVPEAGVILAHHSGWQDGEARRKRERGSSAFRGNADATMYLELDEDMPERGEARLILTTHKIRDAEKPAPLHLLRRRVTLNEADVRGEPVTSCVIDKDYRTPAEREAAEQAEAAAVKRSVDLRMLRIISEHPETSTSQEQIRIALGGRRIHVQASVARLIQERLILPPVKQRQPYTLTEKGLRELQEAYERHI